MLQLEVPCDLPPGPVEVEITIRPQKIEETVPFKWSSLFGLGKEIWEGVDVEEYIRAVERRSIGGVRKGFHSRESP